MTTNEWTIDAAHTDIGFSVRHMVIARVRGRFARFSGTLALNDGDLTRSRVEVTIEAASIDTGTAARNEHLRSADFLDVERFPEIRFRSTKIEKLSGDRYSVIGDLTMRGVTREVALEVEYGGQARDPSGAERVGFVARGSLDRGDFGLRWNQVLETGGLIVAERVDIDLDVEAIKAAAARAA